MKTPLSLVAVIALAAMLGNQSLKAQWTSTTNGTGSGAAGLNYLGTSNWNGGTINDTFSTNPTLPTTVYFNANRTTSGATALAIGGFGPFGESASFGANGFIDSRNSTVVLTLQGGGTAGSVAAANRTLTLGGDLVNMSSGNSSTSATLVLGSASANSSLSIDLGNATRTFVVGNNTIQRATRVESAIINGSLVKQGSGLLVLAAANSITNVVVNRNTGGTNTNNNQLTLQSSGALATTQEITVLQGGGLRIDNQTSAPTTRLNSSGTLSLVGSVFINQFNPAISGYNYTETLGALNLSAGQNIIQQGRSATSNPSNTNNSTIQLTLTELKRDNRSLLAVLNASTSSVTGSTNPTIGTAGNTILIGNLSTLQSQGLYIGGNGSNTTNRSIFTFMTGQTGILASSATINSFVTYDATYGLRGLTSSEYATSFGAADNNVSINATTTISANQTANSLLLGTIAANTALTINSGQTLTITSGAILAANAGSTWTIGGSGTLAFGSAEGIIGVNRATTISSAVTGTNGLTLGINGGTGSASTLSGDFSGLSGIIHLASSREGRAGLVYINGNSTLGSDKDLLVGGNIEARIGETGAIVTRARSVSGGTYNFNGTVSLKDASDGFVIGTGISTTGALILDGSSSTTYISPGFASGPNDARTGVLAFNGGAFTAKNGEMRIDLFGTPEQVTFGNSTTGSIALQANDVLLFGTSLSLDKRGDLKLAVSSLSGNMTYGTKWTIAVAGGYSGSNTIQNLGGGSLFDSVSEGFEVGIGNYGSGTNNALVLTLLPTNLYWDNNGAAGLGGSGTWSSNTTQLGWAISSAGESSGGLNSWGAASGNAATSTGATAVFGGTAGTVTVSGTVQTYRGLRFEADGYTITGGTIALAGSTAANNTITVNSSGASTIASTLSGTNGLVKSGNGTLILSGSNAYSGATTINAGTLQIGNGGTAGSIDTTSSVSNNGTLAYNRNDDFSVSYAISGTGNLTKSGAGTLTLSGSNTYTGTTTISGGTLQIGADMAVGGIAGGGSLVLGAGSTLTSNSSDSNTMSGAISGTGNLTKSGAGALTLSGSNTYSGSTKVNAGSLVITGTTASSSITVNSGGTLGGTGTLGSLVINSGATLSPGNSPGTITVGNTLWEGGGNYNWQIYNANGSAGTGWDLVSSTGTLTINSTSGNKFNINLWGLSGINPDADGTPVGFNAASNYSWTIASFGSVTGFDSNNFAINTAAINGTGGFSGFTGTFSLSLSGGNITLAYTAPSASAIWNSGTGNWSTAAQWQANSVPSDGSPIEFTGSGGTSTNNAALTSVAGLTFTSSASGSYTVDGSSLTIGGGGITNSSSYAQTIGMNLTMSAAQVFAANAANITVSGAVNTSSYALTFTGNHSGILSGNISGSGALTKNGSGTLTLSGSNSYTGATTINAGTLTLSGGSALADSGAMSVASGAVLNLGASETIGVITGSGNITLGSYTLTTNASSNSTFSGLLSGSGGLTKNGTGTLVLDTANSYTGATTINAGTLQIGAGGTTGSLSASSAITTNGALVFNRSDTLTQGTDFSSSAISGSGALLQNGAGTLILTADNNYTGATTINAGTLQIGNGGTSGSIGSTSGITNSAVLIFNRSNALAASPAISGTGQLIQNGSGTLTLSGNNSYTGGSSLNAGTLALGHANGLGTTGNITFGGGTLQYGSGITADLATRIKNSTSAIRIDTNGNDVTFAGALDATNTGGLSKSGNGTLILSAGNSYTGTTMLSGGTIQLRNANAFGATGNITFSGGALQWGNVTTDLSSRIKNSTSAILLDTNGNNITFAGVMDSTNSGGLTKIGNGTLTVSSNNSYTGGTVLSAGTIELRNANALGSTGTITFNGGTLQWGNVNTDLSSRFSTTAGQSFKIDTGANNFTFNTALTSIGGTLTKDGSGRLSLGNNANVLSSITINSGTLRGGRNANTFGGNGSTIIMNGGTLTFFTQNSSSDGNYANNDLVIQGNASIVNDMNTNNSTVTATYYLFGNLTIGSNTLTVAPVNVGGTTNGTITITKNTTLVGDAIFNIMDRANNTLALQGITQSGASRSLTKEGAGTLTINGSSSFNGTMTINGGVLEARAANSLGSTSQIVVNTGGSLLVTASNAINDSATINLSGGTLKFSGNVSETMGLLTLSANSIIDLGSGSVAASFADIAMGAYNLSIYNWTGTTLWDGGNGNNTDQIYFNRTLSDSELGKISFYSDFGNSFLGNGYQIMGGSFANEVIPVPEPETWATGVILLAGLGWMGWRRTRKLA